MEPRPQRPRPQTPPQGTPPVSGQTTQQIGPDPSQYVQQQAHPGHDPGAFVAPPRMEYDYSPLDLQPPGQRRKRQIIAGIIGALVVVAIGALIVAGWMALREDDPTPDPNTTNNRVAELNSTPTEVSDPATTGETTPAANTDTAAAPTQVVVPTATAPVAATYDANTIRTALPVVESMPGPFVEAGDTPQDLAYVTENLGGGPEIEEMLSVNGWQAAMARTYNSSDTATTGSDQIVVSVHAFKDNASAQAVLPQFEGILQGYGWTPVEMEQMGEGSRMLVWTDPDTGEEAVTIYVVKGQLLYRVAVFGPAGFDSTENALYVVNQILGQ